MHDVPAKAQQLLHGHQHKLGCHGTSYCPAANTFAYLFTIYLLHLTCLTALNSICDRELTEFPQGIKFLGPFAKLLPILGQRNKEATSAA